MNVKYHSNQKTTDLFIVESVSKNTSHKNVVADLDLVVDPVMAEDQVIEDPVMAEDQVIEDPDLAETTDQEKCSKQHAGTAEMNVKYHSNQKTTDLFIAESVSRITDKISKLF